MGEVVDSMFVHAHLFTLVGDGVGYVADGAVAVRGTTIVAVGATADLEVQYAAREVIDAGGHALLPGLIDAHMHTPYAIVRGVAQDVANWMQRGLAVYSRHLLPAASLAGTRLNVLEAIKTGTTTMGDYATPYDGWADIFAEVGVRAVLTPTINALPRWRDGFLARGRGVSSGRRGGRSPDPGCGRVCPRMAQRRERAHHRDVWATGAGHA